MLMKNSFTSLFRHQKSVQIVKQFKMNNIGKEHVRF
jgi:hypothetical protein